MSLPEVWYVVHPKGIVAGHAKHVFFAAERDTAIGARDQQFSATIPLYTMLACPGKLIRM